MPPPEQLWAICQRQKPWRGRGGGRGGKVSRESCNLIRILLIRGRVLTQLWNVKGARVLTQLGGSELLHNNEQQDSLKWGHAVHHSNEQLRGALAIKRYSSRAFRKALHLGNRGVLL